MTKSKKKLSRIKDFITPRTFFFVYAGIAQKTKKSRSFFRINFDEAKSFYSSEATFAPSCRAPSCRAPSCRAPSCRAHSCRVHSCRVPSLPSKKGIAAKGLISLSCSFTFINFSFLKFSLQKFSQVKKSREKSLCSSKGKQRFAYSMHICFSFADSECRVRKFVLERNKSKEKRILKDLNFFYLPKQKAYEKEIKEIKGTFARYTNQRFVKCRVPNLYVLRLIPEGRCNQEIVNTFFYSSYKTNYTVVRPLMNFPRRIITRTCLLNKLPVYPDLSNLKTRYSRNRIRKQIIPSIQFFLNPKVEKALFKFSEFYKQ